MRKTKVTKSELKELKKLGLDPNVKYGLNRCVDCPEMGCSQRKGEDPDR